MHKKNAGQHLSNNQKKTIMKKLVRKSLKQISGGAAITECQEDMSCPRGLCCSTGNICRDPRRYMCI